jgi:putative endonuclease
MFTVYILFSQTIQKYYTGQTQNLKNRIAEHNAGETKSIKNGIPWELVFIKYLET